MQLTLLDVPIETHQVTVQAFSLLLGEKEARGVGPGTKLVVELDVECVSSMVDVKGVLKHSFRVVEDGARIR